MSAWRWRLAGAGSLSVPCRPVHSLPPAATLSLVEGHPAPSVVDTGTTPSSPVHLPLHRSTSQTLLCASFTSLLATNPSRDIACVGTNGEKHPCSKRRRRVSFFPPQLSRRRFCAHQIPKYGRLRADAVLRPHSKSSCASVIIIHISSQSYAMASSIQAPCCSWPRKSSFPWIIEERGSLLICRARMLLPDVGRICSTDRQEGWARTQVSASLLLRWMFLQQKSRKDVKGTRA